jgi:hypothetical protein
VDSNLISLDAYRQRRRELEQKRLDTDLASELLPQVTFDGDVLPDEHTRVLREALFDYAARLAASPQPASNLIDGKGLLRQRIDQLCELMDPCVER